MQIGQRLLRANLISVEQLQAALHAQTTVGGRIGTNLIRMGALDFDTLSWMLGEHTGLPAAKLKHFDRIAPATLQLVPGAVAQRLHAIPLYMTPARGGKDLVLALRDPKALAALDEIALIAGARVIPFVAPELCIVNYLEKLYGISDEVEVRGRAQGTRTRRAESGITSAVALERMMFPHVSPEALSMPSPVATLAVAEAPPPAEPQEFASRQPSIDLVVEEPVEFVPEATSPGERVSLLPLPPVVLGLADALIAIEHATSKDQIADAILGYLRSSFACGLVLIARDNMALGWKGFGPKLEAALVEAITIPLTTPSILSLAYERRAIFQGPPPLIGVAIQSRLFRLLHTKPPAEVIVAPITLGQRVVNLIYAHAADGAPLSESAAGDLGKLCHAASDAFVVMIKTHKSGMTRGHAPAIAPTGAFEPANAPAESTVVHEDEAPTETPSAPPGR